MTAPAAVAMGPPTRDGPRIGAKAPRAVSGHEYPLATREDRVVTPVVAHGGHSYQEHRRPSTSTAARRPRLAPGTGGCIAAPLDYEQPDIPALRYENALVDARGSLERLFRWCEFDDSPFDRGLAAVERLSRRNRRVTTIR